MSEELPVIVGIECGATRSTVIAFLQDGTQKLFEFGPANFALSTGKSLSTFFTDIKQRLFKNGVVGINKVGVGMAGILKDADKQAVHKIVASTWQNLESIWVGSDQETALACLCADEFVPRLIVICGTGSCCYGTNGKIIQMVGGYGHVIGDHGSGYAIAHDALRGATREYTLKNKSALLDALLKEMKLDLLEDLVTRSLSPEFTKADIASLAPIILAAWDAGDSVATTAVTTALDELAIDAFYLTNKLTFGKPSNIKLGLVGSLLTENLRFQSEFVLRLKKKLADIPGTEVDLEVLRNTAKGALKIVSGFLPTEKKRCEGWQNAKPCVSEQDWRRLILPKRTALSPTECRHPKSKHLDKMDLSAAMNLWLEEESSIYSQISLQKPILVRIIGRVTKAFQNGGRLFYAGAGTSGRLGILDASECPPTFQTPPHWVQGILAGGEEAIQNSREAAEDSVLGGMQAVQNRAVNSKDVFLGIASSGTTPFVWGALHKAKELGAFTCFLTFNPNLNFQFELDENLVLNVGPEILTGSTRLKCGSATKCILNMISTLSMVQYGKCLENLMVDLDPACDKLKERALRIVLTIKGESEEYNKVSVARRWRDAAERVLVKQNYNIQKTVEELNRVQ